MATRKSINFPGFKHQNPIPNASLIGNILVSSVIGGTNPGTRERPPELAKQLVNVFTHVRAALDAAGAKPEHIIKMNFWMKDPASGREACNVEWVKMFPDESSRPARHTSQLESSNQGLVTCDFMAVIG